MSGLKKSGQRMFVTGVSSCLLPYSAEHVKEQSLDSAWQGESSVPASLGTTEQLSDSVELRVEEERLGSTKKSKMISYVVRICSISSHLCIRALAPGLQDLIVIMHLFPYHLGL